MSSKCKAIKKSQLIEAQRIENFGSIFYGTIIKNHPALS